MMRTGKKPQISPLRYPGFPLEIGGQQTSWGFPQRKPHTWPSLVPRSRKSGYALSKIIAPSGLKPHQFCLLYVRAEQAAEKPWIGVKSAESIPQGLKPALITLRLRRG
jgi:hypothetical protein